MALPQLFENVGDNGLRAHLPGNNVLGKPDRHARDRVFTANLFQAKLIYNFDVRTFVRGIVQYRSVSRNLAKYTVPVGEFDEGLFGQFLFSYKVNPQTVVFVGYSENQAGTEAFDLVRSDRTFFVKLGYAWRP
jgi:hypothetical protein